MRRLRVLVIGLLLVTCGQFVSASAIRDGAGVRGTGELILLHTNDHHGAVLPAGGQGGLAQMASYVRAVRAVNPQVLLLDAGDINIGSALSNMFYAEIDILAYNTMEYDAVVFGNHEFDGTMARLEQQMATATFPFVCSNIKTANGEFLGGNRYIVKNYDRFSVGIFGITTLRTLAISNPDKSLIFINEIEAARETVEILRQRENVDIVIALSHMGDKKESPEHITSPELAAAVPGIDIIVDGHSHSYMEAPIKVEVALADPTWIVSANERGKYIGHGKLLVFKGRLAGFIWKPIAQIDGVTP